MSDRHNIIPMLNSGFLHAGIVVSLLFAIDLTRPVTPQVPLTLKGTVLTEMPPLAAPEPEPEPEPAVIDTTPEPETEPPPDPAEQARAEAEERQRQQDLARERERIAREEEAERQRQLEAERERQRREDAERRRREEAEQERQRQEAERRRQQEIERQRAENERRRQEAEEAARRDQLARELAAEQARLDAMNSDAFARYTFALQRRIEQNWVRPPSATAGTRCTVSVRQAPDGTVLSVTVDSCNGDDAVRRSVQAAVERASPLPLPDDASLFERNLRFIFEPTQ